MNPWRVWSVKWNEESLRGDLLPGSTSIVTEDETTPPRLRHLFSGRTSGRTRGTTTPRYPQNLFVCLPFVHRHLFFKTLNLKGERSLQSQKGKEEDHVYFSKKTKLTQFISPRIFVLWSPLDHPIKFLGRTMFWQRKEIHTVPSFYYLVEEHTVLVLWNS